jgi:hypothetical protein
MTTASTSEQKFCPGRKEEEVMSIPRILLVDRRWGELAAVIEFIAIRFDEIEMEQSPILANAEKHEEQRLIHGDDWDEGYLTALRDIVDFIQRLHSRNAA